MATNSDDNGSLPDLGPRHLAVLSDWRRDGTMNNGNAAVGKEDDSTEEKVLVRGKEEGPDSAVLEVAVILYTDKTRTTPTND